MNKLYKKELPFLLDDMDREIERIFNIHGFYESSDLKKKDFKKKLAIDYIGYLKFFEG